MKSGIYTITNRLTNQIYVGQTVNLAQRKVQHFLRLRKGEHFNQHLQNSFTKHGESAFEFEMLEVCQEEYLNSLELYWMNMLQATNRKFGFNMSAGSHDGKRRLSEATKQKLREKAIGRVPSPETVKSMKKAQLGKKRGPYSDEHRRKISEALKVSLRTKLTQTQINKRKAIIQFRLSGERLKDWPSAQEAAKMLALRYNSIINCCLHHCNDYGGYRWAYSEGFTKLPPPVRTNRKLIYQYTIGGEFVREWYTMAEAARFYNGNAACITCCAKGRQRTAFGYAWRYEKQAMLC